jgi:hypothetical protein
MRYGRLRSERGMVGKAAVIWLFLVAVLAVGALDAVSIARTTLHLSEVATRAASQGEVTFRAEGRNVFKACEAAAGVIASQDPTLKLGRNGCVVDEIAGSVTITLRTTADTFLAGRFGPTKSYTQVVVTEAKERASL